MLATKSAVHALQPITLTEVQPTTLNTIQPITLTVVQPITAINVDSMWIPVQELRA